VAPSFLSPRDNFPALKSPALLCLFVTPQSRLSGQDNTSGLPGPEPHLFRILGHPVLLLIRSPATSAPGYPANPIALIDLADPDLP
jgi:hypothetical protein